MSLSRLSPAQTRAALDATVALTCAGSLLLAGRLLRSRAAARPGPRLTQGGGAWQPWAAFLAVCALLLVNQLVVNAYIVQAHAGDPGFITRFLGSGWFAVTPSAKAVRWLAANLPSRWLRGPLSYSLLRVQAVLELPFALLAYLSVVAMLDAGLYRRLWRSALLPLAVISFTFTFCLIELRLYNPWTQSDVCARWLAAAAVIALWAARRRSGRRQEAAAPTPGLATLLRLFLGAAAVGAVVLVLYDVALLYNLAHLPARLPILGAGVGVGTLAALGSLGEATPPPGRTRTSPGLSGLGEVLCVFSVVFFAPSLSIRYCGERWSAVVGAGLLCLAALLCGLKLAFRDQAEHGIPRWRVLLGLLAALATALIVLTADVAGLLFGPDPPLLELLLLEQAALVLPLAALAAWLVDRLLARRPLAQPSGRAPVRSAPAQAPGKTADR